MRSLDKKCNFCERDFITDFKILLNPIGEKESIPHPTVALPLLYIMQEDLERKFVVKDKQIFYTDGKGLFMKRIVYNVLP